ncbi:hypothetical protein ElyMa_003570500 [Elysia marginata]|uniref:Uncharacterized protein n=1 Tax=Elysia marginata TaxID=1093978 RepID=A0AAV4ELG3_9GAST|nr:hypothetical protein ElyMa_003570500 [Elysia marginata]
MDLYSHQERRLNAFIMRNLRCLLGIAWQNPVEDTSGLAQTVMPSLFAILFQKRLRWLGHVCQIEDDLATCPALQRRLQESSDDLRNSTSRTRVESQR